MKQYRKIKVAIVINNLNIGGAEKLVVNQLKHFDRNRFTPYLITLFPSDDTYNFFNQVPKDIKVFRLHFKKFTDILSWCKLAKVILTIKPDIVVSHLFFSNTVTRALWPFFRYKSITVEHNTYSQKTPAQIRTDTILSYITYAIVTVSETVTEFTSAQENIPKNKFITIANGINLDELKEKIQTLPSKENLKKELGFTTEDTIILNVARLVPQKNHQLLIDGFILFSKKFPQHKLAIVGDGGLRLSLESYVREKKMSDRIIFFGTRNDIEKFYTISDFFVLTSYIEGFSLVCIEAMACGLPVLSTKTAGPDTYIIEGKNGYLLPDYLEQSLSTGMETLAQRSNYDMSHHAIETAKIFNIIYCTKQYEALFEDAFLEEKNKHIVSLITFANLGKKTNLKTIDIIPLINIFNSKKKLSQIICQINSEFSFKNTQNAIPTLIRFFLGSLRRIGFSISRKKIEKLFDFFASKKIKPANVVFFHGGYFLPKTMNHARTQGSILVDITVAAHLQTNAALEKKEFELLNIPSFQGYYSRLAQKDTHTNKFDYIVAMSQFVKDSYVDQGFPEEKIFIAEPDIDIERFTPKKEKPDDIFRVIYIAHTQALKGLHYLLDAWDTLSLKKIELIIVGGFSDMPDVLKKNYMERIQKNTTIRWISSTDKPEEWYNKSDIFVTPSLTEGFGRVTLEAMACGLPVITTENARGIVENGKTGFVIPIRDAYAIKEKIEFLYTNRAISEKMGGEARKAVENKKSFGDTVFNIYQTITIRENLRQ
jgi:glycosyltransferase involved in cell wall biosynthesis